MGKLLSDKESKLQKKLIPLNIFVCILTLVAMLSLFFAPILKIDFGKIIRDDGTARIVEEKIDEVIGDSIEGTSQQSIDFAPVVASVVKQVLGKVEGDITFSAFGFAKLAAAEGDSFDLLLEDMLFSEKGLVNELVDSVVAAVTGMFHTDEGKRVIEQAVVTTIVSTIGSMSEAIPEDISNRLNEQLTPAKVTEISEIFYKFNDAENEDDVKDVVNEIFDEVSVLLGEELADKLNDDAKEAITDVMVEYYNNTLEAIKDSGEDLSFSLETMICVAVSSNLNLGDINIGAMLDELIKSVDTESPARFEIKSTAEGETETDPEPAPAPPPEPSEGELCLTYPELLGNMGLGDDELEEIGEKIKTVVRQLVEDNVGGVKESLGEMGTIYDNIYLLLLAAWGIFIIPWFILFLFAFFHIFAKNKRFMMWYVKLYSYIPALISLGIWLTPKLLPKFGMEQATLDIINIVLGGISSMTWISGICFVLLWLVSIFWAFPIKHKIRKERKACKRAMKAGTYSYGNYEEQYGHAVTESADDGDGYYDTQPESYDDDGYDSYDDSYDSYDDDGFDDGSYDYSYNDDYDDEY